MIDTFVSFEYIVSSFIVLLTYMKYFLGIRL